MSNTACSGLGVALPLTEGTANFSAAAKDLSDIWCTCRLLLTVSSSQPGLGFQSAGRFLLALLYCCAHLHIGAFEDGVQFPRLREAELSSCSKVLERREAPEICLVTTLTAVPIAISTNKESKQALLETLVFFFGLSFSMYLLHRGSRSCAALREM